MAGRPQEGNIAWKIAAFRNRALPGNTNRRQCKVIRKNGQKCKRWAIKISTVCYQHGGQMLLGRIKQQRAQKLRYAAWTERNATSNARRK